MIWFLRLGITRVPFRQWLTSEEFYRSTSVTTATAGLLLAVVALVGTAPAFSQKASTPTTTYLTAKPLLGVVPPMHKTAMPVIAPLYLQDNEFSSQMVLVNNAATAAGATITVHNLTGAVVAERHIKLDAASRLSVAVADLLSSATEPSDSGSISVQQDAGLQGTAVNAQLLITDHRNATPAYLDEELAMPSMEGSMVLRGVTDAAQGPALLAITNIEKTAQNVTVSCAGVRGPTGTQRFSLAAYATSLLTACTGGPVASFADYVQHVGNAKEVLVQGIEVEGDGPAGTLAAFAIAPHLRGDDVFLSAVPFTDPWMQISSTTVFAGAPFGRQSAITQGTYIPHISLANFSEKAANITVTVIDSHERQPRDGALITDFLPQPHTKTVSLSAGETTEVVLNDARNETGLLHSITIVSDQTPGDVQSKVVSRGDGALYEVELLGKDLKGQDNAGGHPWSTQGDEESHLLLYNPSTIPITFLVRVVEAAGIWEKQYVLSSNETRELSLNQLIGDGVRDDSGRVLDGAAKSGVVYWSTVDPGHGTGRLLVSSQNSVEAHNFSCGYTYVACGAALSVLNNGITPLGGYSKYAFVNAQCCLAWGPGACGSLTQVGGSCGTSIYWDITDTSVVNFQTPNDQYSFGPNFAGVNFGSTFASANITENGCGAYGFGNPSPNVPVPTYFVSPSAVSVQGECYSPNVGSFYDVSYYVTDPSGNRINIAGMTPLENAPGTNGQFRPFASPAATSSSDSFDDTPVGSCFTFPPGTPPATQACSSTFTVTYKNVLNGVISPISTSTVRTDCALGQSLQIQGNLPSGNRTYTQGKVN